ncbi:MULTISPECIES: rod shape-determining protein [Helicobacter]|uniref:Cell shape-determining protein MreB n=2 Tax=Helicobacter TaxID=209 RepID=A0A0K2XBQ8_9HELI|nr:MULTISPECIES: rod shape-determining protein [Helicobacter]CRF40432.1 Rod shape-determining protein MreB [Helicobacter ailurogastricus]CRF43404.1 Rod shape-determining protein MreB [Helicobacter ailurogastricus]CRF43957.1 Rod shape-determining protein MreB [Helicobacter ailurogastricus]CRF50637.1 Rod shape-determining protein MreB [Helicobacter heilmannii]CRF52555.1 Rod shape-determining protein MreB [Helicobacter ailurogastricus]
MILDKLIGVFSHDVAIDLGTANTVVSVKGQGIIINEPSIVAVKLNKYDRMEEILAVGTEAKEMIGKTPAGVQAIRPMKDGVIADFNITEKMIRYFIEKAHKRKSLIRPRIMVCVPYGLTSVERKAVKESAMSAGAREVFLIEEPMAAAIGAGLPVKDPQGSLIVDIGGGTTEIGVISLGGLVVSKSIRVAGNKLDASIVDYVRKTYNLQIGERTGEEIKIAIGSAIELNPPLTMEVSGRDQVSGILNTIELNSEDVREAIKEQIREISNALKSVLEEVKPDLARDLVENGVVLTGGGALIRGLDKYLSNIVKLPVFVGEEPLLAVARGTSKAIEDLDLLSSLGDI